MKTCHRLLLTLTFLICSAVLFAQNKNPGVDSLLKQGVALNDAGKFAEAIAKYDEALKIEPNNMTALYEKGYTLSVSGKPAEAIPCFEKVIASRQMPNAYVALANIYDTRGDFTQAEKYYTQGIAAYPNYGSLWYNLGLCYLHQKLYPQAQSAATRSIKLNQKHAASYQIYGVAAYFQDKNAEALMGLSNFLLFNPPPQQAKVACVLVRGILVASPSPNAGPVAKMQQETIAKAATSATAGKTNLTAADSLTMQLTAVYKAIKAQEDQYGSVFFSKYFGNYFGDVADSNYMDIFTRFITVSLSPHDNLAWLKAHQDDIKAFNAWLKTEKRQTE